MTSSDWSRTRAVARSVLTAHHGLAPLQAFVAAGLTPYQVAALHRQGVLRRPRIGWYLEPDLPWYAGPAVRVGGVAACVSAAASWGLPVPPDPQPKVHVGLAPNASRLRHSRDSTWRAAAGTDTTVELHWSRLIDPPVGWRVGLVDALLQLADCVPLEWWIAALDAALHVPQGGRPLLSEAGYARLVEHLSERMLPALALVDPRAESCIETLLRLGLVRRGITGFDLQFWPTSRQRVDIVVRDRVLLEADGEQFHDPVADAIRDAELRRAGWIVLRFAYDRIVYDLESVLDEIEALLATL